MTWRTMLSYFTAFAWSAIWHTPIARVSWPRRAAMLIRRAANALTINAFLAQLRIARRIAFFFFFLYAVTSTITYLAFLTNIFAPTSISNRSWHRRTLHCYTIVTIYSAWWRAEAVNTVIRITVRFVRITRSIFGSYLCKTSWCIYFIFHSLLLLLPILENIQEPDLACQVITRANRKENTCNN